MQLFSVDKATIAGCLTVYIASLSHGNGMPSYNIVYTVNDCNHWLHYGQCLLSWYG